MNGRRGVLRTPLQTDDTEETVAQLTLGLKLVRAGNRTTTIENDEESVVIRTVTPLTARITARLSDRRKGSVSCPTFAVKTTTLTVRR